MALRRWSDGGGSWMQGDEGYGCEKFQVCSRSTKGVGIGVEGRSPSISVPKPPLQAHFCHPPPLAYPVLCSCMNTLAFQAVVLTHPLHSWCLSLFPETNSYLSLEIQVYFPDLRHSFLTSPFLSSLLCLLYSNSTCSYICYRQMCPCSIVIHIHLFRWLLFPIKLRALWEWGQYQLVHLSHKHFLSSQFVSVLTEQGKSSLRRRGRQKNKQETENQFICIMTGRKIKQDRRMGIAILCSQERSHLRQKKKKKRNQTLQTCKRRR